MLIRIKNLKIDTILGVYEWENYQPRTLIFNAEIETDCQNAAISDDVKDTIDYDHITNKILDYVKNNRRCLIETMVSQILDLIMQDERISRCTLEIDKLKVYDFIDSFSIVQTRIR